MIDTERDPDHGLARIAVVMDVWNLNGLLRSIPIDFASLVAVFTGFPQDIHGPNS